MNDNIKEQFLDEFEQLISRYYNNDTSEAARIIHRYIGAFIIVCLMIFIVRYVQVNLDNLPEDYERYEMQVNEGFEYTIDGIGETFSMDYQTRDDNLMRVRFTIKISKDK